MARIKKNKGISQALWTTIWLSLSVAGGVLFAFGLIDWFKEMTFNNFKPVMIGFILTYLMIYLGQFRTENYVATRKK